MSLHQILETLIHHTTFRTEAEQHQALDLLDSSVDHEDPAEGARARTTWQPPVPTDASGAPITVPTGMTSAQADELISLLKSQQAPKPRNVLKGESDMFPEDAPTPDVPARPSDPTAPPIATPPVTAADVPEGVK